LVLVAAPASRKTFASRKILAAAGDFIGQGHDSNDDPSNGPADHAAAHAAVHAAASHQSAGHDTISLTANIIAVPIVFSAAGP
jgi:hypothetical protein